MVKIERRAVIGTGRLEQVLRDSEDSVKPNTSFVERLNLTIRQGSSYRGCRTICQARWTERLADHIELFRCHYNFIKPHRALKFGREFRTPAMQAGLTRRRLTFRDVFEMGIAVPASKTVIFIFEVAPSVSVAARRLPLVA